MKTLVTMLVVMLMGSVTMGAVFVYDGEPSQDTGIYAGFGSDLNWGLSPSGDVGYWDEPLWRTLFQWDLPNDLTRGGATVTAATLEVDVREAVTDDRDENNIQTDIKVFVAGIEHEWVEGHGVGVQAPSLAPDGATQATYDGTNSWEFLAPLTRDNGNHVMYDTAAVPKLAYNSNQVVGVIVFDDIIALVQEWADGRPNYGLAVARDESQSGGSISVFTKESGHAARLHIEYVPEPATGVLLGIGCLLGLRRRKK